MRIERKNRGGIALDAPVKPDVEIASGEDEPATSAA